ncbi:Hsp20/alpha crystallin family protein [Patescibacteria group bacterium]|nr:Hsp20/alpha crystallin family protein [Patescibacteria group bacterium]MBU1016031.1 Hsp20/alpha crystallin family protein [Patescibacteria group bacterium]MBU1685541.1 Hsp20/alpha crystallin family protein [Patescibacteria group bacterium]MBU1938252.1 Hsp20/alpha crystallin family protein [Patescibacteria group bacterium]
MKTPFATKILPAKTIKIGYDAPAPESEISQPDSFGQLPVDVLENKNEIRIVAPLAGVNIEEVEIVINNDVLTIKGQRTMDTEVTQLRGVDYYAQECFWGEFSRSVILPLHADTSQIEATQKNHILYVRIPKKPSVQMRIVKIKTKD